MFHVTYYKRKKRFVNPPLRLKIEKKEKENSLMGVFDALNAKYGRGTLAMGVNMLNYSGGRTVMRRDFLSPEYTTDINQIPSVY